MRPITTQPAPRRILLAIFVFFLGGTLHAQSGRTMKLTLSNAIDIALKQNRNIKLAQLAVTDSEHKKEIARSSYFPHIKNESSLLHLTELAGVAIPAGAFAHGPATGLIPGEPLFIGQGSLTTYTSGTGLAQPLTQMFKIRESNRAATADVESARITVNQAENDVALKVRQLYYGILIAQLRQQAATEEVKASQIKYQESADAVQLGKALDVVAMENGASLLEAKQAVLTQNLQARDLTIQLNDLLGLPLDTKLELNVDQSAAFATIPAREEALRIAVEQNPEVREAQQQVIKARAGLAAAKDAYIPDITGIARYSYQSGVPLLVHNFGTFGVLFTYDLFDGGRRSSEVKHSRALLAEAELNLSKAKEEVSVRVETAYDKVEQLQSMVGVVQEVLKVREESARLSDKQYEQNVILISAREQAHAKSLSTEASLLEANLGLALAQGELKRAIGEMPR